MKIKEQLYNNLDLTDFSEPDKLFKNLDFVIKFREHFDLNFFYEFFDDLKESGIVNMFGAAPYLYLGSDKISSQIKFEYDDDDDIINQNATQRVIEKADRVKMELINSVMGYFRSEDADISVDKIKRGIQKFSSIILATWMTKD